MATFKWEGIVLGTVNVKDHDRYVTLLTPNQGLVELFARGARRTKSPLMARTDPFISGTFMGFAKGERYYLDQVDIRYSYPKLKEDAISLATAAHLVELIRDSSSDPSMIELLYPFTHIALYVLEQNPSDWMRILAASDLYLLNQLGLAPDPRHCGLCGERLGDGRMRYDHSSARFICHRHPMAIEPMTGQPLYESYPPSLLEVLHYIYRSGVDRYLSFRLGQGDQEALWDFVNRELRMRLERDWPKLRYLEALAFPKASMDSLIDSIRSKRQKPPEETEDPPAST